MEELLQNPAIQAGVLPFVLALVMATVLRNTRQLALPIAAGFACAVALTMGFGFESLTSVKKLVLAGIGAAIFGAVLEVITRKPQWPHRAVIAVVISLAVAWVLQRILLQRETGPALLAAAAAALYGLALMAGGERASHDPVRAAAVALVVGLGSGALALLGASAQLAQLGIALGAGSGAVLLVQMIRGASAPVGWTLGFSAHLIAALVGLLAVFTGSLPWYALLPLPLVGWFAGLAPTGERPVWQRAVLHVLFALVPALVAVALAWFMAGGEAV